MSHDWSPESLARLSATALASYEPTEERDGVLWWTESVAVQGDSLVVTVSLSDDPATYALRIDVRGAPTGPLTGERCDTPEQWAGEVLIRVMEQVETGGLTPPGGGAPGSSGPAT